MAYEMKSKSGFDFYEVASLLQKSLRRGDLKLASKAANELFPKYANYTWNRLMTVSAEDCAEMVTQEVVALYDAWDKVNKGKGTKDKGRIFIAKAIVLLAKAQHSRDADELNILVSDRLPLEQLEEALAEVDELMEIDSSDLEIPRWVYDVHTRKGKRMGMTKSKFLRDESDALTDKTSIFENLDEMIDSKDYVEPKLNL